MRASTLIDAVRASALWAAYGDALGFITEGADARALARRLTGRDLQVATWRRKIGYRGPEVELPAGCYSDDTQLRLATSRAIGEHGKFDVDAFATIELPLWPVYSLGGGRGSLDAARRLGRRESWRSLVHRDKSGRYVMGGGNGGAMRVQPLVWSGLRDKNLMHAVVENVACTHGHPKAFVGALFHVYCLSVAIDDERLSSSGLARNAIDFASAGIEAIFTTLGEDWTQTWNRASGLKFPEAWKSATQELSDITSSLNGLGNVGVYRDLAQKHGLLEESERGSATKTAAIAYAAVTLLQDHPPERIVEAIVSTLGSDTDSIATMAGAVLGAALRSQLESAVLDREYLVSEAMRVVDGTASSRYVEVASQKNPVIVEDGRIAFGALGEGVAVGPRFGKPPETLRWYHLNMGQTILVNENDPRVRRSGRTDAAPSLFAQGQREDAPAVNEVAVPRALPDRSPDGISDVAAYARRLVERGLDPTQIGKALLSLVKRDGGEGFAAVLAYEVVRMARAAQRRPVKEDAPQPEPTNPRAKPTPLLQLQLTARFDGDCVALTGIVGNYGRETASDVRVVLVGRSEPLVTFEKLDIQERHDVNKTVTNADIMPHDRAVAYFRGGSDSFRQEGAFEATLGRPDTLLLKGLGPAIAESH